MIQKFNKIINDSQLLDEIKASDINAISITKDINNNIEIDTPSDCTSIVNAHIPKIRDRKTDFANAVDKLDFIAKEMGLK